MRRHPASGEAIVGFVLGAGFGTRLRPLTLDRPKPLLPVGGKTLLERTLRKLADVGCRKVVVNTHHLAEKIPDHLGPRFEEVELHYSHEDPILGTLGALAQAGEHLSHAKWVVLVNGDSLCDWPLEQLVERQEKTGAAATLLTTSFPDPEEFGGGVSVDGEGRVLALRGAVGENPPSGVKKRVFAGAHVFSPELIAGSEPRFSDIVRDLYEPLLAEAVAIETVDFRRPWFDLGTPLRYRDGALSWMLGRFDRLRGGSWPRDIGGGSDRVKRSVIEPGAHLDADCRVENSLVLPGARVEKGCRVKDSIIGFDARLPPGISIENRLVTPVRAGHSPGEGASVVDSLVYSPMTSGGN